MTEPSDAKRFFTWVDADYSSIDDVPGRIRLQIISLSLAGVPSWELGEIFKMPAEWVEEFTRGHPGETKPN